MSLNNRKRLLFIVTRQFWPTSSGKEITLYFNCKGLSEEYGYDIYLLCFADRGKNIKLTPPSFIREVKFVRPSSTLRSMLMVLVKSFVTDKWPIQNSLYYSGKNARILQEYYDEISPDVIMVDMLRLSPYAAQLKNTNVRKILIADDLLAKRYRRQLQCDFSGSAAGYYGQNMNGIMNRITSMTWLKTLLLKTEIPRLEAYEKRIIPLFDSISFVSPIETLEFNALHNTDKGVTLTMGADIDYLDIEIHEEQMGYSMSLVADFTIAPNVASLRWIYRELIPLFEKDVKLYVIGKCSESLKKEINCPQIIFLGFVEDIRPIVKATKIYLSPIAYGTGIKTKVVEAMAMGMPVITNSVGAEGLNVTSGIELYIADNPNEIVSLINQLFRNEAMREKVGKCAQSFVRANHTWGKVYEAFSKMGL